MKDDDLEQRLHMVNSQIVSRGIKDPATLSSIREVPRHLFVPETIKHSAYDDSPLPIGYGQTISQPYIVALMTTAAQLTPDATVLDIGTGSGYAAAILSRIVKKVCTIERIPELAEQAQERFQQLGYSNIFVKTGDGTLGWPEEGPFDAIIVTAGAPVIPESFYNQLKEGGRIIIPVGDAYTQQLLRLRKQFDGKFSREMLEFVRFVPLIGEQGWSK